MTAAQLHFNLLAIRDDPLPTLQAQLSAGEAKNQSNYAFTLVHHIISENEKRE